MTYVPDGWGTNWKAARAASGSALASVAVVGDSISHGMWSSNLDTTSWVGRVRTELQTVYGDGGSGFKGIQNTSPWFTANVGASSALTAYTAAGNIMALTGTWGLTANPAGPAGNAYLLSTSATGATLTASFRGTKLRIYSLGTGDGSGAGYTYAIDGGSPVTVTDPGTVYQVQVATATGLSAGSHTVVITKGTTGSLYMMGIAGENSTGVVVNQYSQFGGKSWLWSGDNLDSGSWAGGANYPASLVIYELGGNDAAAGTAVDTWLDTEVRQYLDTLRDNSTTLGAVDLMFVLPHAGSDDSHKIYHEYAMATRALGEQYNAAVVDFWTLGRNSWNYWNSLGYWGNSSSVGSAGTDPSHLSDAGHTYMASTILSTLLAA